MRALRCRRITSERKTSTSHADPIADPLTNEGIEPRRGRGGTRGRCGIETLRVPRGLKPARTHLPWRVAGGTDQTHPWRVAGDNRSDSSVSCCWRQGSDSSVACC